MDDCGGRTGRTFSAGLFSWYVLHRHGAGLLLSVLFSMLLVLAGASVKDQRAGTAAGAPVVFYDILG